MSYLTALLLCAAAAGFEALCAGRDPMGKLSALNQPSWSPPNWAWVLIGLSWYGICFAALARLLPFWPAHKAPIMLIVALMLANGAANIFQLRLRRLDLGFWFALPYWLLLAGFIAVAWPLDRLSAWLFAGYAVYQIYGAAWSFALWRLNRPA